jgi:2-polyprenyl-6-methoxyphenol hydroxylase-like FAD-dependent oxidoreductase
MTETVSNITIIIVGAGIAGLAASLGLAKQGFQVELVERRIDWSRQGSAFGLAANGHKALKLLFGSPEALVRLLEKGIYFEAFDSHLFGW